MTEPRVLVVIPARGGSKGIPRKNLRALGGRPLISYSIETALARELRSNATLVGHVLASLQRDGLLEQDAEGFSYRPALESLDKLCAHLEERYRTSPGRKDTHALQATSAFCRFQRGLQQRKRPPTHAGRQQVLD